MQPTLAGGPSLFGGSGRMATSIFDDDDDDDFVKQDRGGVQNLLADGGESLKWEPPRPRQYDNHVTVS